MMQRGPRQWDDGFAATKSAIPEYHAYADPHSAGYMGQLKKNGHYTKYMRNVALQPGGIRSMKQRSVIRDHSSTPSNALITGARRISQTKSTSNMVRVRKVPAHAAEARSNLSQGGETRGSRSSNRFKPNDVLKL